MRGIRRCDVNEMAFHCLADRLLYYMLDLPRRPFSSLCHLVLKAVEGCFHVDARELVGSFFFFFFLSIAVGFVVDLSCSSLNSIRESSSREKFYFTLFHRHTTSDIFIIELKLLVTIKRKVFRIIYETKKLPGFRCRKLK